MTQGAETGQPTGLLKCPTGIPGLDEITEGGIPKGRPTLLCGGAGAGKTLLAMQFLQMGARLCGEPGVFVSFEETAGDQIVAIPTLVRKLSPPFAKDHRGSLEHRARAGRPGPEAGRLRKSIQQGETTHREDPKGFQPT